MRRECRPRSNVSDEIPPLRVRVRNAISGAGFLVKLASCIRPFYMELKRELSQAFSFDLQRFDCLAYLFYMSVRMSIFIPRAFGSSSAAGCIRGKPKPYLF
jgi:hypothetical protein